MISWTIVVFYNMLSFAFNVLFTAHFQQDGGTPLFMASQNGHTTTVDVLLSHGANPNIAAQVSEA